MIKALWGRWLLVAKKIAYVQSLFIMTVVYFVVLGPFALAIRFFSDPLGLRGAPSWQPVARGREPASLASIRQQF